MKRICKRTLGILLALLMLIQLSEYSLVLAAEAADRALHPAEYLELTVPERFRDGKNWFFIPEQGYQTSEKSSDKLYIPIQRTGDLSQETEVVLKLTDLTARHDVNYTVSIYKEKIEPEIRYEDMSIKDIALNGEIIEGFEVVTDENELGSAIYAAGGAEIVDGDGSVIGTVTALPEGASPAAAPETGETETGEAEAEETEAGASGATGDLMAARNAYTGTVSDRQELAGSDLGDLFGSSSMSEEEYDRNMAKALSDDYPGKEYTLAFAPGEEAKILVITPRYSSLAEGDAQILLMLKNPGEGWDIGEDVNPVSVTIFDDDEPEPVVISMAEDTVYARDGKAVITVNREGRFNAIKGVQAASWDGSAHQGDEYSGVGAKLWFPMGVRSRSFEIPVYHGTEEKDFYVTLSPLEDETVENATVHVIIPPAEGEEGGLMGQNEAYTRVGSRNVTEAIDIRTWSYFDRNGGYYNDTSAWIRTNDEAAWEYSRLWIPTAKYGYAYDGVYVDYDAFVDWCAADVWIACEYDDGTFIASNNEFDEDGITDGHYLNNNWGKLKAPNYVSFGTVAKDDDGYIIAKLRGMYLIKRKFSIEVEDAEVKPLIGVSNDKVLTDFETVLLDDSAKNRRENIWLDESFSLTAANSMSPLRLVGVEAKMKDGKWKRIATIDGKSSSAVVVLTADLINSLAEGGAITWKKQEMNIYGWRDSYTGSFTVRPVFDYIDVSVDVQESQYGVLYATAPNPYLLYDFGDDAAAGKRLGLYQAEQVLVTGGSDGDGTNYFTFEADMAGDDPRISLDRYADNGENCVWVKVRARTDSAAPQMQLYARGNGGWSSSRTVIPITGDGEWHEYVTQVNNPDYWSVGGVEWIRLDPLDAGVKAGDRIDIDYIAFFPDEDSARSFRSGRDFVSTGRYTYHLGDDLTFYADTNRAGEELSFMGSGVEYDLRQGNENGTIYNQNNTVPFLTDKTHNGTIDLRLTGQDTGGVKVDRPYYCFRPVFTERSNSLVVRITEEDYEKYFRKDEGLFRSDYTDRIRLVDGYYVVTVDEDILTNEIYELDAFTLEPEKVIPKWTVADGRSYYGDTLYVRTNQRKKDNIVTLSAVSDSAVSYIQITGTVTTSTMNLSTERSATDCLPVQGAYVSFGPYAAWTDENGAFTLPAILYMPGSRVRVLITYNGVTTIHELRVPGGAVKQTASTVSGATVQAIPVNGGILKVANIPENGPRVTWLSVIQEGVLHGTMDTLSLNGKKLTVRLHVDGDGTEYVANGETYTEHIKEVLVYFQSQINGETRTTFSSLVPPEKGSVAKWSWDEENGDFTLEANIFSPDQKDAWDYGDVLMVQIITDRKSGFSAWEDGLLMRYEPVSTGYAVVADPDYEPVVFNYSIDDLPGMLQIEPPTDEDGELLDETRYSFGAFPYLGEITGTIGIISKVFNSASSTKDAQAMMDDLSSMSEGGGEDDFDSDEPCDPADDGLNEGNGSSRVTIGAFFKADQTVYGGVRFMVGVIATYGGGEGYHHQENPYSSAQALKSIGNKDSTVEKVDGTNILHNGGNDHLNANKFGGAYFTISVYFGFYLDYGYVEITKTSDDGADVKEKSHEMVFMGAGGFIGFTGKVGYTQSFVIVFVPAYFNVEGGVDLTVFLGSEGNPEKTLKSFKESSELKGQDFSFSFEFKGRIFVQGTIGVGMYKVLGARVTVGVGFEFGYSNKITDPEWAGRQFDTGWGYVMEATFTGTLDLVVTSIELYSATWPLPVHGGFMYYYQEMRRANKCIGYVQSGMKDGKGSAAARTEAATLIRELSDMIDGDAATAEELEAKTKALKEYAYENEIISWVAKNAIEMNKQGGIIGSAINASLQDEDSSRYRFHTNDHVDSQWVADDGQLMATYSVAKSVPLMKDAYAQPSSKIIGIGGSKYLVVFLDDTLSRDRMQAATLMWTIYDANNDTWTEPQAVQADSTADSKPNLVDAGDKVILSWASATDRKYDDLKARITLEKAPGMVSDQDVNHLGIYTVDNDTAVYLVSNDTAVTLLEADPARALDVLDIFTVEFDKSTQKFGPITQLTDDLYYDDNPQAVYDEGTKDYILLYSKTALNHDKYTDNGEKLMDIVGASADPGRTYSVMAYMLYNGSVKTDDDGTVVPVGWLTDYLFNRELPYKTDENNKPTSEKWTSAEFIAEYGPERYLQSTIQTEKDGKIIYVDPPIYDLTVAAGYNDRAALAFTVDTDLDLRTSEDKKLYIQFYNFQNHRFNPPIAVAGSVTEEVELYDAEQKAFVTKERERQVEVGMPRLIRNGGNTFLFWRQDGAGLSYLNVTRMMTDTVAAVADPDPNKPGDWTFGVKEDGTFATDAKTGRAYAPDVWTVDVSSGLNDGNLQITDYEVITDEDDNLYLVWTDTVTNYDTNEAGETYPVTSQEIYAAAMIRQEEKAVSMTKEDGTVMNGTTCTVRWSKPYRLTRENGFNDGLALALDPKGGLIIVHNQYFKKQAQNEEELFQLIREGKIGLTEGQDHNLYAASLSYNSPVSLMVTRCDKVGSLEATRFQFSDDHPVAGQTVTVTATIENVGLTDAQGYDVEFYEYKDKVRGRLIDAYRSDEDIQVNTAKDLRFLWTVPAEGVEGYCIQAVVKEKRSDDQYYEAVDSYSEPFSAEPKINLRVTGATQEGDRFRIDYVASNTGNADVADGASLGIRLVGLHGKLDSERYGNIKNSDLYSTSAQPLTSKTAPSVEDGPSAVANTVFGESVLVDIPASLFRYCGYDAVQLVLTDKDGMVLEESSQFYVRQDQPMNLSLNGGKAVSLTAGRAAAASLTYDSTVFMEAPAVVYAVEDPTIARVDVNGTVTGLRAGTTTLTATLLPSGASAETMLVVNKANNEPMPAPAITVEVSGDEGSVAVTVTLTDDTATIAAPTDAQMAEITDRAGDTGSVTIDLSSLPETVTAVSIPAETVKAIDAAMQADGEGLTILLPDSKVCFDAAALAAIAAQTEGEYLTLNVEPVPESALTDEQREALAELETQAVYDIYLTSGDERISDFGDGWARITVRHKLTEGKQPGGVVAWYLPEEGGRVRLATSATAETASFTVRHFSNYALSYDRTLPAACPRDESCPMTAFTDLNKSSWYHDGVHWAIENGVMNGVGNNKFDPSGTTSRGMIVTMLWRMEGKPASDYAMTFEDVAEGKWYAEAVRWAAENGIVNGYSAAAFGPNDPVTREQIVTILLRYANYKGLNTAQGETALLDGFTDVGEVSDWAVRAFRWAVDAGIIEGVANGVLAPKQDAPRAQVATMLMRYLNAEAAE